MIICDTERRQNSHLRISQDFLQVRERSIDLTASLSLGSPSSLLDDGSQGNHIPTLANATGCSLLCSLLRAFRWALVLSDGRLCNAVLISQDGN